MAEKFKVVGDVKVMQGTKAYELLESKDPADHKKAKRLMEFTRKCDAAGYEYTAVQKLRKEFSDVV